MVKYRRVPPIVEQQPAVGNPSKPQARTYNTAERLDILVKSDRSILQAWNTD